MFKIINKTKFLSIDLLLYKDKRAQMGHKISIRMKNILMRIQQNSKKRKWDDQNTLLMINKFILGLSNY